MAEVSLMTPEQHYLRGMELSQEFLSFVDVARDIAACMRQANENVDRVWARTFAKQGPLSEHQALEWLERKRVDSAARALRRTVG